MEEENRKRIREIEKRISKLERKAKKLEEQFESETIDDYESKFG